MPETAVQGRAAHPRTRCGMPLLVAGKEIEPSASIGIAIADAQLPAAPTKCCATPTSRCTAPRRRAASASRCSTPRCRSTRSTCWRWNATCAWRCTNDQFEPYFQPIQRLETARGRGLRGADPLAPSAARPARPRRVPARSPRTAAASRRSTGGCSSTAARSPRSGLGDERLPDDQRLAAAFPPRRTSASACATMLQRTGLAPSRLVHRSHRRLAARRSGGRAPTSWPNCARPGVGAALDDFGTGYSSLSYLHTLPAAACVKIDRSFVAPPGHRRQQHAIAVVVSILALARALGMEAVAEGIETAGAARHAAGDGLPLRPGLPARATGADRRWPAPAR